MYEGSKALFRAALATFKLFEDEILKLDSFEKAFPVISRLPSRVTDIAVRCIVDMHCISVSILLTICLFITGVG
jgi:hypothetical protein